MDLLTWVVVGLIVGWLTGQLSASGGYGAVGDVVMGIIGAVIGGLLATLRFEIPDAMIGFNLPTLWAASAGAVVMITIYRLLPGRSPV